MSSPYAAAENTEAPKKRTFAGFKSTLRYRTATATITTEVRYGKMDVDPAFSAEGVGKAGPHGGRVRYQRGEWKVFEIDPKTGKEAEISEDDIKYVQEIDTETGKQVIEVEPFDRSVTWDIFDARPLDESTLDGPNSLGTVIPAEKIFDFGPDKDNGSQMYWVSGDDSAALKQVVDDLEKGKSSIYFPLVFRKGLTIHLAVLRVVRKDSQVFFVMQTFGGNVIYNKPIKPEGTAEPVEMKPVLARPVLKKKPKTTTL